MSSKDAAAALDVPPQADGKHKPDGNREDEHGNRDHGACLKCDGSETGALSNWHGLCALKRMHSYVKLQSFNVNEARK